MSSSTLRPNGDVSNTGAALTGAASYHAALSDDSDSSYGSITTGEDIFCDVGTVSMGTGAITKNVTLRARADTSNATNSSKLYFRKYLSAFSWVTYQGDVTFSTTTGEVTTSATPVSLTQAQVDDLVIGVEYIGLGTGNVYELYIDLTYLTQPSTSVTAVSPDP